MSVHKKISWIWKKVMPLEQSVTLQQINSRAAAPWVDRPSIVFLGQRWSYLCQGMAEPNPGVFPWFLFLEIEEGKPCKCIPSSSTSFLWSDDLQHVALEHVCLWFWVHIIYMNILWICLLYPMPQAISSFLSTMTSFFWLLFVCMFVWTRHQKDQKISWVWKKLLPLNKV